MVHELTLGVQKVYKYKSHIIEHECGFSIYYNKSKITHYILYNYQYIFKIINKYNNFDKIAVYSDIIIPQLTNIGFKKTSSSSVNDNIVEFEKLNNKQLSKIRRSENLLKRDGFKVTVSSKEEINNLFDKWVKNKYADERVYKITFSPNRYKNATLFFENTSYNFYNVEYKNQLIASIAFYNEGENSYQLTYLNNNDIRLVNDQYELILWSAFKDRFSKGITKIYMGTSGGLRGLSEFKNKFLTSKENCFGYEKKNEHKGIFF